MNFKKIPDKESRVGFAVGYLAGRDGADAESDDPHYLAGQTLGLEKRARGDKVTHPWDDQENDCLLKLAALGCITIDDMARYLTYRCCEDGEYPAKPLEDAGVPLTEIMDELKEGGKAETEKMVQEKIENIEIQTIKGENFFLKWEPIVGVTDPVAYVYGYVAALTPGAQFRRFPGLSREDEETQENLAKGFDHARRVMSGAPKPPFHTSSLEAMRRLREIGGPLRGVLTKLAQAAGLALSLAKPGSPQPLMN